MSETILQIRSNGQITLPASIRKLANLAEGDTLAVLVEPDGSVRLVPKLVIDRSQAYFWTEQWQQGEKEAQEDVENGRLHRFETVDDGLTFLDADDDD